MTRVIIEEVVDLNLEAETVEETIEKMAQMIYKTGRVNDFKSYLQSVLEREKLSTTGIGFTIAIPHGKSTAVKATTVAFSRLAKPVAWNSLDGEDVSMVFLLAVPEECKGNEHLKIIATLSRKLIHEDFRKMLSDAKTPIEITSLLEESLEAAVS